MKLTLPFWRAASRAVAPFVESARQSHGSTGRALMARIRLRWPEALPSPHPEQGGSGVVLWSFIAFTLVPTVLFLLYAVLWETSGYVSEIRMTVQAAEKQKASIASATSMIGRIFGAMPINTGRDGFVVLNYIRSSAIIEDIGGRGYLEAIYAKPSIDYFSRLPKGQPIEKLLDYWQSHIIASVDTVSGILIVKVTAFDPKDAQRIAQDINRLSEKLINAVSLRSRKDALDVAEGEVKRSAQDLAKAREKLLSFRNQNQIIDPVARATSLGETIAKMTLEKIDAETSLDVLSKSTTEDTPTKRVLSAKINSIGQQIEALKSQLTAPVASGPVSSQIADYESLKLEEMFAERLYIISQDAYLRARQELTKQQLYLVTVVPAVMPEEATYPKVITSTLLLLMSLAILWSIAALIAASIQDQME